MRRKPGSCLRLIVAGFLGVATALAVTTLIVVHVILDSFRAELREHIVSLNDPFRLASFQAALAQEQHTSRAVLALILVVGLVTIASALLVLQRHGRRT
jgi:ABC-type lipoprotein release transport system permease subunit